MIKIKTNGPGGNPPEPIEALYDRLANYPLDPVFEECGGFMSGSEPPAIPRGWVRFHGNFYAISAVFSVDTDDDDEIASLRAAIESNMASTAYAQAKFEFGQHRARVKAHFAAQREEDMRRRARW